MWNKVLIFSSVLFMSVNARALILIMDDGGDSTYSTTMYTAVVGSISANELTTHTGPRSTKAFTDAGAADAEFRLRLTNPDEGRITMWVYLDDLPVGEPENFADFNLDTARWFLIVSPTGIITLNDFDNQLTIIATGTAVISADTWTRISVAYDIGSTTVNDIRVYVGGTLDITVNNETLQPGGGNGITLGYLSPDESNKAWYFDDIYVDDQGALLTDVGDHRVTAKLPIANATNNFNANIGNNPSNRWENCDERPLNTGNGWEETGTADVVESFGVQSNSQGDVDMSGDTQIGVCGWIYASRESGGGGTPGILFQDNDIPITLTAGSNVIYSSCIVTATDPSGATDDIGMHSTDGSADTLFYEAGVMVAYQPAAPPPTGVQLRRRIMKAH